MEKNPLLACGQYDHFVNGMEAAVVGAFSVSRLGGCLEGLSSFNASSCSGWELGGVVDTRGSQLCGGVGGIVDTQHV